MIKSVILFLFIFLLGFFFHSLLSKKESNPLRTLSLSFLIGVLFQHGLFWFSMSLKINLIAILFLGSLSLILKRKELLNLFKDLFELVRSNKWTTFFSLWFMTFLVFYTSKPLSLWDSRSIWFFHSKILFFDNGFIPFGAWKNHFYEFSHLDYPKLIPQTSAQHMHFLGYWNEIAPKTIIFLCLNSCFLYLISFLKRWPLVLLSSFFLFLCSGGFFWNGYMDGLLALFASLSVLSLFRKRGSIIPQIETFLFLSLTLLTKNEGMLFSVSFGLCLALYLILKKGELHLKGKELGKYSILLFPPLFYQGLRNYYQLKNDLKLGSSSSLDRLKYHFDNGGVGVIGEYTYNKTFILSSFCFSAFMLIAYKIINKKWSSGNFPFLTAIIYSTGLFVIYLLTPLYLPGHLGSSLYRTSHLPMLLFFVGIILCLKEFNSKENLN